MRGIGIPLLARDRRNIDDAAIACLNHGWDQRLANEERRDQVDVNDVLPNLAVQFPCGGIAAGNAGVVDHNIDAFVRSECPGSGRLYAGFITQLNHFRAHHTFAAQCLSGLVQRGFITVPQDHLRAR